MTSIEQRASETVAKIMAEVAPKPTGFEENAVKPYRFDWAWTGRPGQSDYTYQKKYDASVIEGRKSKKGKGGGVRSTRQSLATMSLPCPLCSSSHSPLSPCA